MSPEEQQHALSHEGIKEAIEKQDARRAEAAQARAAKQQAKAAKKQAAE